MIVVLECGVGQPAWIGLGKRFFEIMLMYLYVWNFVLILQEGGLGEMKIPLLSDYKKKIAYDYGVLIEGMGAPLRSVFALYEFLVSVFLNCVWCLFFVDVKSREM